MPKAVAGIVGKFWAVMLIALLGLTGALAATCFVKAFGITFLAKPRSAKAEQAAEVHSTMLAGMAALSLACVAAGVWPQWMLSILEQVAAGHEGISTAGLFNSSQWYAIAFETRQAGGALTMPVVVLLIAAGLLTAIIFARWNGSPRRVSGETWTCGIIPTARMEYTATGFAQPIRRAFGNVLNPVDEIVTDKALNPYHGVKIRLHVHVTHYVNELLYNPLKDGVQNLAQYLTGIQAGSLQLYIGYIMAVTVVVLIISTRW